MPEAHPGERRSRWFGRRAQRRRYRAGRRGRARDLGHRARVSFAPGPLNAITDVAGVRVGHTTLDRGRSRPHRRHVDRAARRQRVPGQGAGRGVRRQRVRQARGLDASRRARHDRNADRADQHVERRRRDRGPGALDDRSAGQRGRALGQRARRRNQRRRPQRHSRPARAAAITCSRRSAAREAARSKRAASAPARARAHFRLERRHRHLVAQARRRVTAATRWACSCSRTTAAC